MRLSFKGRTLLAAPAGISTCSSYPCRDSHHVGPWPRSLETLSSPCSLDWLCFYFILLVWLKSFSRDNLHRASEERFLTGAAQRWKLAPLPSQMMGTERNQHRISLPCIPLHTPYSIQKRRQSGQPVNYSISQQESFLFFNYRQVSRQANQTRDPRLSKAGLPKSMPPFFTVDFKRSDGTNITSIDTIFHPQHGHHNPLERWPAPKAGADRCIHQQTPSVRNVVSTLEQWSQTGRLLDCLPPSDIVHPVSDTHQCIHGLVCRP